MKMKAGGAIFATLEIVTELAANQRAMNKIIISSLSQDDAEKSYLTQLLNEETTKELDLIRARLFRHSETNIDDFLNGDVDI